MHLNSVKLGFQQDSYRRHLDDLHVAYWRKEGAAPVRVYTWSMMVASCASLCKWMPLSGHSSWYFCFWLRRLRCPSRRENPIWNFFIFLFFGYRELKVGREYMVKVFNGFINAWFDFFTLTSKYKLWLCSYFRIIKKFLVFLMLPFFRNKHKRDSRDRNDLLLMMENTWSKKPYISSLSSRAGRKDFWKV